MKKGITIIELLVVVVVMTVLLAIALPAMKTAMDERRLRVAAEMVREQFRAAAALAAEHNCSSGVVLICDMPRDQPQGQKTPACLSVGVLQPATMRYAGDVVGSQALLTESGPTGLEAVIDDAGAGQAIHVNDLIRFDHQWDKCRVVSVSTAGPPWVLGLARPAAPPPCPCLATAAVPYRHAWYSFVVLVQPTAVAGIVELPRGSCVDLSGSGFGRVDVWFRHLDPVTKVPTPLRATVYLDVLPNGSIGSIRFGDGAPNPMVSEIIHILVGHVDGVAIKVPRPIPGDPANVVPDNATKPGSRWVRVQPRTGRAHVVQNYWTDTTNTIEDARSLED